MNYPKLAILIAFFIIADRLAAQEKTYDPAADTSLSKDIDEYKSCLYNFNISLFVSDLNNKNIFPISGMTNSEAQILSKLACVNLYEKIIFTAKNKDYNDSLFTQQSVKDTIESIVNKSNSDIISRSNQSRPYISQLIEKIKTPGPRGAVEIFVGITNDDYPPSALRNHESGISTAVITVSANGKINNCSSAGATETLNSTTCTIIMRRAKFAPAIDYNQNKIESIYVLKVRWGIFQ